MTTLYEAGIEECKHLQTLSEKDSKREIKRTVKEYFELDKELNKYYLLLCNENKDYTMFVLPEVFNDKHIKNLQNDLYECMKNRGELYGCAITTDKHAIELWLKYDEDQEPHCYLFFPFDLGVVHLEDK